MKILRLIQITRPYGWIVFIGMFLVGMKLADASLTLFSIIYMILMTIPLGLVLFGINDVYDYRSDRINPRKKQSIMGAVLKINELKFVRKSVFVSAVIMLFIAALSFKIWNFISVLLLILISYAYSAPPLRLKEIPVLESVSNAIIIYLIVMLGFTLNALPWEITCKAYYLLIFVVAYHIFSTVMDADADAKAGHKTFAVRFGRRAAAVAAVAISLPVYLVANFESTEVRILYLFTMFGFALTAFKPKLAKLAFSLSIIIGTILGIVFLIKII